jgi:D-alanine-D-alanine ligase
MSVRKQSVAVLFGGRSGEHPISIRSSRYVVNSLDRDLFQLILIGIDHAGVWHLCTDDEYGALDAAVGSTTGTTVIPAAAGSGRCGLLDPTSPGRVLPDFGVAFPILHGPYGEDGTIQGLLEMLDVAYVGPGVLGASVCMDKDVCKRLLRDAGVPIVPFEVVTGRRWVAEPAAVRAAAARLGTPLFVKPANLGSSLGVSRVTDVARLDSAIERALSMDTKILIERGINGREIECAVLGNDKPEASVPGEIVPGEDFYSFDDKYAADSTARLLIPAPLSDTLRETVRSIAAQAFVVLQCAGMARIDFFLEKETERLYVNEVNTIPGFTSISMYPKLWEASGIGGQALVTRLVELALERHAARRRPA